MKFNISVSDNCSELEDHINEFLDAHPGIIIHSHQFATCGTSQKNKYVTIFYDEAPDFINIKDKNHDKGTEGSL
jgi:hypothetical protein